MFGVTGVTVRELPPRATYILESSFHAQVRHSICIANSLRLYLELFKSYKLKLYSV